MDLQGRPNAPQVDLIMRARSIRPADDSAFVNEVFNVEFTDYVYSRPQDERAALLDEVSQTNYAVADLDLIQQIFKVFYDQKVARGNRLRMLRQHDVRAVRAASDGVHLQLFDQDAGRESSVRYDAVVLATGYMREQHKDLLQPLAPTWATSRSTATTAWQPRPISSRASSCRAPARTATASATRCCR
jgi:L-ornithine N5-oxygenase